MANQSPTLEQAEARVKATDDQLHRLADDLAQLTNGGVPFGDSLEEARRIRLALEFAEQEAIEAWADLKKLRTETESAEVAAAKQRLDEIVPAMVEQASKVEALIAELVRELGALLAAVETRDEALSVMNGRSRRSKLARNGISEWIRWKLSGLKLPDLRAWTNRQYRKPLAELLGVAGEVEDEST